MTALAGWKKTGSVKPSHLNGSQSPLCYDCAASQAWRWIPSELGSKDDEPLSPPVSKVLGTFRSPLPRTLCFVPRIAL